MYQVTTGPGNWFASSHHHKLTCPWKPAVAVIVLAQRLTCQSTSRDIARYRFSFCRFNFCDLNIVFRIIRSRSLREARGFAFFTRPTGSYIPRRETRYTIRDRISVGSMRLVIFQWCEKIRTRRRSVAFNLHNATPRQLFAASFSCSSPSWPMIVLYTDMTDS